MFRDRVNLSLEFVPQIYKIEDGLGANNPTLRFAPGELPSDT